MTERRRAATTLPPNHTLSARLRRTLAAEDPTGRRVLLLGLFAVLGFWLAVYYLRKQGTETNQYIGVVWALGLLAAAGWHVAQRRAGTAAVASGCVALSFVLAQLAPIRETAANASIAVPDVENVSYWGQVPPGVLAWTRHHSYYGSLYDDLNVSEGGPLYPNLYNFIDKLAAGIQPMFLVRALLDRRIESVSYLNPDPHLGEYAAGYGKWEANYIWKLNEVIATRYVALPGMPPEIMVRRPGPEQGAWMRDCFGPFAVGGVDFRIRHGGGFWCSFSPGNLRLVRAPTPLSEVVTTRPASLAGTVDAVLTGQAPAQLELRLEAGGKTWTARVAAPRGNAHELEVSSSFEGASLGTALVPIARRRDGRREVRLEMAPTRGRPGPPVSAGVGVATLAAPATSAQLALIATNGTNVDLQGAHLGH